ncbi:MAG TPA: hypothetical protein VGP55_01015 [Chitinophagaceae bacterium]|nr:hypothetical protein [Chitinophagaceae bacterium]
MYFDISFVGCGSAEAIKGYRYPVTKDVLEKAVMKVIKGSPNIYRDSSKNGMFDSAMQKAENEHSSVDSAIYYNDGKHYVTIKIKVGQIDNDYIFRFYGDEQYWKTSASSEIFINYVRDRYGNALSQGHNENGEFKSKMAKEFTSLFETEFINKLDKELNLKHY